MMSHLHAPSLNVQNSELQIEFVFCLPSWYFQKWIFKFNEIRKIRKFLIEKGFLTNCYFYSVSLKVPIWNVLYLERWMTLKRTWIENEANLNWQSKLEAKLKFASKLSESESRFSRVKIAFGSVKFTFQSIGFLFQVSNLL